jgi:hypothetical protein
MIFSRKTSATSHICLVSPKLLHRLISNFDTTFHSNRSRVLYTYYIHVTPVTGKKKAFFEKNQRHQPHLLHVTATHAAPPAPSVARKSNTRYTNILLPPGVNQMCAVRLPPGVNQMCAVLLPPGVTQMCAVLLLPGVNQMCAVLLTLATDS